jgi:hypothetical protein
MSSFPDDVDEELLPDGASVDDDGGMPEFNMDELRVDFSQQESSSEARDFTPIPSGKYRVAVTDVEVRFSTSSKNKGKPYYAVTLTVQDGPYEKRKLWANVMLFNGALYSLVQIMKAMGLRAEGQGIKPPTADELQGETFIVSVVKQVDDWKVKKQKEEDTYDPSVKPFKNEVKSFFKDDQRTVLTPGSSGADSLLP